MATTEEMNEAKSWFFTEINKINRSLAKPRKTEQS